MPPAVMQTLYQDLTGDCTTLDNPVMKQRVYLAMTGEEGILPDLRHSNPGRPSDTFSVFWTHMGNFLDEVCECNT